MSVALVALLVFAVWLAFHSSGAKRAVSVGFSVVKGHFPEPAQVVSDEIAVLWVTNIERSAITLSDPYVQFENEAGRLVIDQGSSWNQNGYSAELPPGSAAWLANGFDRDRRRLKFAFEYHRDCGPSLRGISKAIGVLPLKRLPERTYDWLRRNGLVGGTKHVRYESPWIANPRIATNPAPAPRFQSEQEGARGR